MINLRDSKPADLSLVFDSWMNSWRTSKYAGVIPNHLYFHTMRELIEGLITRGAKIVVATDPDKDNLITGWVCYEIKDGLCVLHYLYIRDMYAGSSQEIADGLLAAMPGDKPGFITFKLADRDFRNWKHVPEIARRLAL